MLDAIDTAGSDSAVITMQRLHKNELHILCLTVQKLHVSVMDDRDKILHPAGLVNPAAVELQPFGWMLIVMHYKGCFGSNCTLQVGYLL